MGANRAMDLPVDGSNRECFHLIRPLSTHRTQIGMHGFCQFTQICKVLTFPRAGEVKINGSADRHRRSSRAATPAWSLCHHGTMNQPQAPKIQMSNGTEYREGYANSVQIRVNLWDFLLLFGLVNQTSPDSVAIQNFQGIYLSPQQA